MYRINTLLKQDQKLFHTGDLALLWQISNKNTLYTTIKRYLQRGILIPIHKGFYATVPVEEIDPLRLAGGFLHRFSYVSCETILIKSRIIFQAANYLTLVSDISKIFSVSGHNFKVRKMKSSVLYNDYEIISDKGILMASPERAVADMLYFNPHFFFDNRKAVNWKKVTAIQKEVGY